MTQELFVRAEEVASELGISKPYAYKLVREMNEELKQKGFITIPGPKLSEPVGRGITLYDFLRWNNCRTFQTLFEGYFAASSERQFCSRDG